MNNHHHCPKCESNRSPRYVPDTGLNADLFDIAVHLPHAGRLLGLARLWTALSYHRHYITRGAAPVWAQFLDDMPPPVVVLARQDICVIDLVETLLAAHFLMADRFDTALPTALQALDGPVPGFVLVEIVRRLTAAFGIHTDLMYVLLSRPLYSSPHKRTSRDA